MEETAAEEKQSREEIMAARREARRKKILENSSSRLSKIVGHELSTPPKADSDESKTSTEDASNNTSNTSDDTETESSETIYPDPPDERMEFFQMRAQELLSYSGLEEDHFLNSGNGRAPGGADSDRNGDIFQLLNTLNHMQTNGGMFAGAGNMGTAPPQPSAASHQAPSRANSTLGRVLRTKIHLVAASIVAYLLFATGNESFIGGNVFLPLLAWELLELLTIGVAEPAGGQKLLGIVFLLGGIPMKTSQTIMKLMNTVNKVLKDVAFFMFFFVLTHLLWSRFWLGIDMRYVLGYDKLEPVDSYDAVHS